MKILIIGDGMLDKYVSGMVKRTSPEDSSVSVLDFSDEEYRLGGAFNVAANIKALSKKNVEVFISSIMSEFSANLLKDKKIGYDEVVLRNKSENEPHKRELIKTRFIKSDTAKQLLRLDNREKFHSSDIQRYKNKCYYQNFIDFDMIVVSDYDKGIIDDEIIKKLESVNCLVLIDTKKKDLSLWKNLKNYIIKINNKEFLEAKEKDNVKRLVVTQGKDGCSYYENGSLNTFHHTTGIDDADTIGAGDVFLAGLAVALLEKKDIPEALKFANRASYVSVGKFGTSIVERIEIYEPKSK